MATKKLPRYVTRAECQALINHAINRLITQMLAEPVSAPCECCEASVSGVYAGPDCGHAMSTDAIAQTVAPHSFTLGAPCA